ncbi:uncharacterized protein LOC114359158 isoform X1 [Ostrinia furnacalis]|uniref:uncharacterized protein LOC114359158 isoform X1 n=1 Tax=Ostrinia furnacalis TaxID=93504 RepID=UPI00103954C9|nr:uncharacterized protein LOC114359158 isoform X1 [Ostrinia furnacalis]
MNNQDEVEAEVSPYIPSARRSIHQHNYCIFPNYSDNMGRYGLKANNDDRTALLSIRGHETDEVDNVMSKFTRETSPVPLRRKRNKKIRRNSLSISNQECTDDDESDSNLLAKSLPANLPSYYCSDDAHQSLPSDFFKANNSTSFSETRANQMIRNDEYNYRNNFDLQNEDYVNESQIKQKTNSYSFITLLLLGIIGAIAAFYYNDFNKVLTEKSSINSYDQVKFRKDMDYLGEKYKINDNSILEVQSGISTILERNDTGSFIFVYNGKSVNFDFMQFSNLVEEIATTAARFLRNDSTSVQPTVVHSSELHNMQSHSELMNEFRHDVAKTGVMLVKDVDKIPSSLAMAFHYFCDEYNPLVAKSAIFFTLDMEKCSNLSEQKSTHSGIEKCLANKWNTLPKDNVKPLLARVVSVVINVTGV